MVKSRLWTAFSLSRQRHRLRQSQRLRMLLLIKHRMIVLPYHLRKKKAVQFPL